MKVQATFNKTITNYNSYSEFYRWANSKGLFVTKNGQKDFSSSCKKIIFRQKDGSELLVERVVANGS